MKVSVLNEMEIDLEVNETDIVHVQVGDTADVEIDAFSDQTFKGVVTEVGYSALNSGQGLAASTEQVTNFSVKVKIVKESYASVNGNSENNSPFKPGMSATVKIHTDENIFVKKRTMSFFEKILNSIQECCSPIPLFLVIG
jgi:HlyD family secretion protein